MQITEHVTAAAHVVAVEGQLDSNTSSQLEDVLCARMQAQAAVIVDLNRVPYVSSAGLRVLLKAAKIGRGAAHSLVLAGLAPRVLEVFEMSGFSSIFRIEPDLAAAEASLA
ncbi:STAS domain-containing protein [Hyphomicrobium sp. MC1]|uniref:STAS domain-containing protein n=1 Tax=Hyphomicrobium sp. (strain MC1) TaxID=717785 RepID=UPI000213EFE8|nr:STAS domain-containing protein [Hyphomicrobium sp. MC1]CCB66693.1 putative anti-sigma factor antagonist BtrV [Hyphomicrobium sp. MC1]